MNSGMSARARRTRQLLLALGLCAALTAYVVPGAASGSTPAAPDEVDTELAVTSKSDPALAKLDPKLRAVYDRHDNKKVAVFVSVVGNPASVEDQLDRAYTANAKGAALVVGRIDSSELLKLAGAKKVLSVNAVNFEMDGTPVGEDFGGGGNPLKGAEHRAAVAATQASDVPHSDAPPPRSGRFAQFKKYNVLDAKTHNFTEAWRNGFTGKGSTVAVFDSGTDWSHPDLIGATVAKAESGWPAAFDPYGTLQWLADPSQIDAGLSWYVRTTLTTCVPSSGTCSVTFATKTGPSRNLANPPGTAEHAYTFPSAWSKSGDVRLGSHPDDYALEFFGERPAFLVTDPNQAGVYDTIYVDLNNDHDFSDEKPVTKKSPRSWRDVNGDGYVDLSGGMAYYISDGAAGLPVPGGLEDFGLEVTGEPGELVAWTGDFDPGLGGHGTLCTSNIAGQGVTNAGLPTFSDIPGGKFPAAVVGGAPRATMVPFGDIYFGFDFSTQFAYLLSNEHGIDVTSNSYGNSDSDNDGLDAASQEADIWHTGFGGRTTPLFSTGNGAPGYGTTTPPSPVVGISVGASTQYGATGWDSIKKYSQVNENDVANWSNRGPGATGTAGVDLVADGAYSPGSINLTRALQLGIDGQGAWETWGGTSRSTPVAAGAAALVYQAYRGAHGGGDVPESFYGNVRQYLKSGATDLGYDTFTQGSGSLNAGRAVRLARGASAKKPGVTVSPDAWRPGDYRGESFEAFPSLVAPGESDTQTFQLSGRGRYRVSDQVLRRTAVKSFDFDTSDLSEETPSLFNAPNYLVNLTKLVKQHRSADLMVIRANMPYDQLDPEDDYAENQLWRLVTYNWTDLNRDGRLWRDKDRDGTVDNVASEATNHDGDPVPDFAQSEIQRGEYARFTYINQSTNAFTNIVRSPARRMKNGVFMGLYHPAVDAEIPVTDFHVEIEFYENRDWAWVSTPRQASGSFKARVKVPRNAPFGLYDGAVVVSGHGQKSVVPVTVNVAATAAQDSGGQLQESMTFGGKGVAAAQANQMYNNGAVYDAKDWAWRPESGDWRFFYYDVPQAPPPGTKMIAQTDFAGPAPHNDLDTLVFGPTTNQYQLAAGSDPVFAPYALGTVGGSANTNEGAGVWTFDTATGTNQELVSAPASEGLHAVVQHQVNAQHDNGETRIPFETRVGSANVSPDHIEESTTGDSGSFDVTFSSGIDLEGLVAEAFGLSQPTVTTETAQQDDPADPETSSVKRDFSLNHASSVTISTALADDLDLFVLYDFDGDGEFTLDELVGVSAGGSGNEQVTLHAPPDGDYQVWVHGFAIAGNPTYPLTIDAIQGNDLTVTGVPDGVVPAGTPVTLHVEYAKAMTAGQDYFGELLLGPPTASSLLSVPITVHRE